MKEANVKTVERLSLFCHICGMFSVFIGLVVTFIDLLNGDVTHIQIGLYIFATGYAFVKISSRLSQLIMDEGTS